MGILNREASVLLYLKSGGRIEAEYLQLQKF